MYKVVAFLLLASSVQCRSSVNQEKCDLRMLAIVHRHSSRAPMEIPESAEEDMTETTYPRGLGRLTSKGILGARMVGDRFRKWYPSMFTGDPQEIWARSSSVPRCFETMDTIINTIYNSKSCGTANYNPIPIINPPAEIDDYIMQGSSDVGAEKQLSPLEAKVLKHILAAPIPVEVQRQDPSIQTVGDAFKYLSTLTKVKKQGPIAVYELYQTLDAYSCQRFDERSIPTWYYENEELIVYTEHVLYRLMMLKAKQPSGCNLSAGIVNEITKNLNSTDSTVKVLMYGYHDITVSALAQIWDVERYLSLKPSFLGAIFFEVRVCDSGEVNVVLKYSNGLDDELNYGEREPLPVAACNNSNVCSLETMIEIMQNGQACAA